MIAKLRKQGGTMVILALVCFSFGFSWIEQGKQDTSSTQQDNAVGNLPQSGAVATTNQISEKIAQSDFSDIKNAVDSENALDSIQGSTSSTRVSNYSSYRNITDAVKNAQMVSSGIVDQARSINQNNFAALSADASKLQRQINNIIQVTDQFKALQEIQVKQIELVTKQARDYKEIMTKLEEENNGASDLSDKDAMEILRQAQIRQERNN